MVFVSQYHYLLARSDAGHCGDVSDAARARKRNARSAIRARAGTVVLGLPPRERQRRASACAEKLAAIRSRLN